MMNSPDPASLPRPPDKILRGGVLEWHLVRDKQRNATLSWDPKDGRYALSIGISEPPTDTDNGWMLHAVQLDPVGTDVEWRWIRKAMMQSGPVQCAEPPQF